MEVLEVQNVRKAEIDKKTTVVNAEAAQRKTEIDAEAAKRRTELEADAQLVLATQNAEGIKVEATEKVGLEQAKNISDSNIKIIAGAGSVSEGVTSALDVLTPKGGMSLAGMLETLGATETGEQLLAKLGAKE